LNPKLRTNLEIAHLPACFSAFAMNLPDFFEQDRLAVDAALDRFLPAETMEPRSIHTGMRYSVFAGGKRIRPILCLEAARIFEPDAQPIASGKPDASPAMHAACAIEFIHTYSLIHDDLPALDNDDLRRGKPTCHKKFGEATAILAGDGLLTLAFQIIGESPTTPERTLAILQEVSSAAGTVNGMVGGQVADLESEGKRVEPQTLEYIHRSKTAALIRASVSTGAISAGAGIADVARLRRFGETIGWAFQVTDDILDVEESSAALGKTAGKDIAQQKATYPAVFGVAQSHEIAAKLANDAIVQLDSFGERASRLRALAEFLVQRRA
jgi:geranylgeranyl diphosphate synthase type II